jgi:hypothetical protein
MSAMGWIPAAASAPINRLEKERLFINVQIDSKKFQYGLANRGDEGFCFETHLSGNVAI